MIFYFSGVGNSAWVARKLGDILQDKVLSIAEEIRKEAIYAPLEGERVGFVFPVYGWEPPRIVLDFIRKMQMQVLPSYLYFVCTCGDDTGKTASVFMSALSAKGWKCHASYSILMPDTYVCLPGFDIDGEEVKLTIIDKESSNKTNGHRFSTQDIVISNPDEYVDKLRQAHVYVDQEERKQRIIELTKERLRDIK